jgi:hypothetical protein
MKATIWKYPFPVMDNFEIEMPITAKVVSVQIQQGQPCMWAIVNARLTTKMRKFKVVGTGHGFELMPDDTFIGTFQMGDFVGHLFEMA